MPSIWLLRHGSSHSNEGGSSADSWQIPLTIKGEAEAREAARHWTDLIAARPFRLVCSPMLRARQTVEPIRCLHPHVALEVKDGLREFEPYEYSHLPPMQPDERRPLLSSYWARCDPDQVGDGRRAESFAQFRARVEAALADLRASDVDALAVCHGGVIKLAELLQDPGSQHLDASEFMRAWLDRPTLHNCGFRQFESWPDLVGLGKHPPEATAAVMTPAVHPKRRLPAWVIFHVPHDSTDIPAVVLSQFALSDPELRAELIKMTDHFTGSLFTEGVPVEQVVRAPVSRLVVDVERFVDDRQEPMASRGMGAVYTLTSEGRPLRRPIDSSTRQALIDTWYRPHHARLTSAIRRVLAVHGQALLVDAHSFASAPLPHESDQRSDRPQICIGTDEHHTPMALREAFVAAFRGAGFVTEVDRLFSGALVPRSHHRTEKHVCAVMVEVNRALYLNEATGERNEVYEARAAQLRQCMDAAVVAWAGRV